MLQTWQGTCPSPANLSAWLYGIVFRLTMQKSTILESPSLVSSLNSSGKYCICINPVPQTGYLDTFWVWCCFPLFFSFTTAPHSLPASDMVVTPPLRSSACEPSGKWLFMSTTQDYIMFSVPLAILSLHSWAYRTQNLCSLPYCVLAFTVGSPFWSSVGPSYSSSLLCPRKVLSALILWTPMLLKCCAYT